MSAQLALMGGMAALDMVGKYHAAENMRAQASLQRDIAEVNAEFAELDAYDSEIQGYTNVARYQRNIDKTLATQQLRMTAANIDVNYGSAASIQRETRFTAELNRTEIIKQAHQKATSYRNQASQIKTKGFLQQTYANSQADALVKNANIKGAAIAGYLGYKGVSGLNYTGYGADFESSLDGTSELNFEEERTRTA